MTTWQATGILHLIDVNIALYINPTITLKLFLDNIFLTKISGPLYYKLKEDLYYNKLANIESKIAKKTRQEYRESRVTFSTIKRAK